MFSQLVQKIIIIRNSRQLDISYYVWSLIDDIDDFDDFNEFDVFEAFHDLDNPYNFYDFEN